MIEGVNKKLSYGEGNPENKFKLAIGVKQKPLSQESTCKDYIQDVVYSCLRSREANYCIYGFKSDTVTNEDAELLSNCDRFQIYLIERSEKSSKESKELERLKDLILSNFTIFEEVHNVPTRITVEEDTFKRIEGHIDNCLTVEVDKWYLEKLFRLSFLTLFVRELTTNFETDINRFIMNKENKETFNKFLKNEAELFETFDKFPEITEKNIGRYIHNYSGIISTITNQNMIK